MSPSDKPLNPFFPALDALRGLAVLWVVVFHYDLFADTQSYFPGLYALGRRGYLGVQIFFVISGYCLAAAARNCVRRNEPTSSFLYRRMRRIYPPLWFSMLLVVSLPWLKWFATEAVGREESFQTPLFANFHITDWLATATLLQGFRLPGEVLHRKFQDFNVVYWSLAIEVQFYMIMALAIVWRKWYYTILLAVSIWGGLAAWDPLHLTASWNTGCFLFYWPMFAWGILLYELRMRGCWLGASDHQQNSAWGRRFKHGLAAISALAIQAWILWTLGNHTPIPPHFFAALVACTLWLTICWEQKFVLLPKNLQKRITGMLFPLGFLGTISYSVYLIHFNLHKLPRVLLDGVMPAGGMVYGILLLVSVFMLAVPFYWLCERPFAGRTKKHGFMNSLSLNSLFGRQRSE